MLALARGEILPLAERDLPDFELEADIAELERCLFDFLLRVAERRQPEVAPVLKGEAPLPADRQGRIRTLQAIGIWFQLLTIAEENAAMRLRRRLEREVGPAAVPDSFAAVLQAAAARNLPESTVAEVLAGLSVEPVITAHPTEAKRVTVLEIHRRIYRLLVGLEETRWSPDERAELLEQLEAQIDLLWLTGEIRLVNPSVEDEAAWGLHFFEESLFERVPRVRAQLARALERHYPALAGKLPSFLSFGSWIGGDRDGNPNVTLAITRQVLLRNRQAVLLRYRERLLQLARLLSPARHALELSPGFTTALARVLAESVHADEIVDRNPGEVFRQYASALLDRIDRTLGEVTQPPAGGRRYGYADADLFIRDLADLEQGLLDCGAEALARQGVRPLRWEAEAFRFATASLDLRQNAEVVNETLVELWSQRTGRPVEQAPLPRSAAWTAWLSEELARPLAVPPRFETLSHRAQECFGLFRLLAELKPLLDRRAVGSFILSLTSDAADVLGVYLLAKWGGLCSDGEGRECVLLPIVPLFESIDDLRRGPQILRSLFAHPLVRRSLKAQGSRQEVMIGYSDSNKDGGFLAASLELAKSQAALVQAGERVGITVTFFHGRGGSVSRGGAPTARAIAAQPLASLKGRMRLTEQGEVVSSKYANRGTAQNELETLVAAALEHCLNGIVVPARDRSPEANELLEALAGAAHAAYRGLIDDPGLVAYFRAASPVEELALLRIGSRPARRRGATTLADLRAIPWVFAWSQNRHMVTGWYGFGSAMAALVKVRGPAVTRQLRRLFAEDPLVRLLLDEIEKSLMLVDLEVAAAYAGLVPDEALRGRLFTRIREEHQQSLGALATITGAPRLGERFPRLAARLKRRSGLLSAAGQETVRLLVQLRQAGEDEAARREVLTPLLISLTCVASGLGWTG